MREMLAALAAFIICSNAVAQTKIAIKAGATYSTAKVIDNGAERSTAYKPGFTTGIQFKVPFDGLLHFSPYAVYSMRRFQTTYPTKVVENTIHYIDLVPALSIDIAAGDKNSFVVGFGPVLGFTNFGNQKITQGGSTITQKMKFGFNAYGWIDMGVTGSIGFHTKKIFAEAAYYRSLTNINNNEDFGPINIQARMFCFNLGYYIK